MILIIPGKPVAQQRHRSCSKGGKSWLYDPCSSNKSKLKKLIKPLYDGKTFEATSCIPLVSICVCMPITTSLNAAEKKLAAKELLFHTKKPDIDNFVKFYMDLLTGILFHDDACVQLGPCFKIYSPRPRTVIELKAVEPRDRQFLGDPWGEDSVPLPDTQSDSPILIPS